MGRLLLLITALALAGLATPACAYYDDVHYALTYYIARQVGYTPEQAYRVAKADISIDYSFRTEPVQMGTGQGYIDGARSFLSTAWGTAYSSQPRWRFHAFRNQVKFPDSVGDGAQATDADRMINETQVALWNQALVMRNPGVFLHFFQDKIPHARFGSAFGHWPIDSQEDTDQHLHMRLPIGGSTDWLSFRDEQSNLDLVRTSFEALASYLRIISPQQATREFNPNDFVDVLRALRQANPAPPPLRGKTVQAAIKAKAGINDQLSLSAARNDDFTSALNAEEGQQLQRHLVGPEIAYALLNIDALMKQRRWSPDGGVPFETVPSPPSEINRYEFNEAGQLQDRTAADRFVLTGELQVQVRSGNSADRGAEQVTMRLAKSRKDDSEIVLAGPQAVPINGAPVTFGPLPVGAVIVESTHAGQAPISAMVVLDKQQDIYTIELPATTPATAGDDLAADLAAEVIRLRELLAQLRAQRDAAVQRYAAALVTAQVQLAAAETAPAPMPPAAPTAADTAALCARFDAAEQRLTATLSKLDAEESQVEVALQQARQLAERCSREDANAAESTLQQARDLAYRIDQQATALVLLALQIEDLDQQRQQRLQTRPPPRPSAAAPPVMVDLGALTAALAALQDFDRDWSDAAAEQQRPAVDRLATAITNAAVEHQNSLRTGLSELSALLEQIAQLGLESTALDTRNAQLAALRSRAAARPAAADDRLLDTPAVPADACLQRAPPDVTAGLAQARTASDLAQLALGKLGGAAEVQLKLCLAKSTAPTPVDREALLAQANCAKYPNTRPHWSEERDKVVCACLDGYQTVPGQLACERDIDTRVANTDCSRWPNSAPEWNSDQQRVNCECIAGTHFNKRSQACERELSFEEQVANLDCSNWDNTEAYWDTGQNRPMCRCRAGYQLNQWRDCERQQSAQEQVANLDCSAFENSEAYWDGDQNRAMCRCPAGYQKSRYAQACEAIPVVIACNTASKSGANPPETVTVTLGNNSGTANFSYEMFGVPDRMTVRYGGLQLADTGCVSGSGHVDLELNGYNNEVIIQVTPNCRGDNDTQWNFTLSCPQ